MSDLTDEQRDVVERTRQRMVAARSSTIRAMTGDPHPLRTARRRLDHAIIAVAKVLDAGERDPTWQESQEQEDAALALARLLIKRASR